MRSSEKWGVDVETAVDLALKELRISRDEAEIEVLEESSNGFLGIGSKLARVRVTAKEAEPQTREKATFDDIDAILAGLPENSAQKLPDEVRAEYDKFEAEEREDARAREKARSKEKSRSKSKKRYGLSLEDTMLYEVKKLDPVKDHPLEKFLRDIAEQMGATLDAVQCLASYVVNKDSDKYIRVILDAENYRAKREKTLVNLANRLAGKVERTGRPTTLEPMNPYERKVIHCTLQNHPSVKTRSEGKDPYRKVIIESK